MMDTIKGRMGFITHFAHQPNTCYVNVDEVACCERGSNLLRLTFEQCKADIRIQCQRLFKSLLIKMLDI